MVRLQPTRSPAPAASERASFSRRRVRRRRPRWRGGAARGAGLGRGEDFTPDFLSFGARAHDETRATATPTPTPTRPRSSREKEGDRLLGYGGLSLSLLPLLSAPIVVRALGGPLSPPTDDVPATRDDYRDNDDALGTFASAP